MAPAKEIKFRTGGSMRVSDLAYQTPDDTGLAKSLIDLNTVYRFRLSGYSEIKFSSGIINVYFACDPSSSGVNFAEWTTLSDLFSEFKMVSFSLQLVPMRWFQDTLGTNPLGICGNLGTAVNPGSYGAIMDNADAQLVNAGLTSNLGYTHTVHGTHLNYSVVSSPTTDPYAGAPGSIQLYQTSTGSSNTQMWGVKIVGVYDFRSRV
jgi:hypothetical protein